MATEATKTTKSTQRKTKPSTSTTRKTKATTSTTPAESVQLDAPVTSPVSRKLNDVRADGAPVLGHFVEVVSGEHKGAYGVFIEAGTDNTAVVRTRDDSSGRLSVKVSDLQAAKAGRR